MDVSRLVRHVDVWTFCRYELHRGDPTLFLDISAVQFDIFRPEPFEPAVRISGYNYRIVGL